MNEFVLLAISIISGIFGLIGLQLMQQNWYKREDLKYKFDVKRARLRKRNLPVKSTSTPTSPMDWIEAIKKLDPEMVHSFIDTINPSNAIDGEYEEGEQGLIEKGLQVARDNPELAQNFLKGLKQKTGEQQGNQIVR